VLQTGEWKEPNTLLGYFRGASLLKKKTLSKEQNGVQIVSEKKI